MNTKEELNRTADLVKEMLETNLQCRNDDNYLIWKVWRTQSKIFIPFEDFKKLTPSESITRARRKVVEQNPELSPTDDKVRKKRGWREEQYKEWSVEQNV